VSQPIEKPGTAFRVRYLILTTLFTVTVVNYADRATLSIAGTGLAQQLGIGPIAMGYIFSAFAWSYVVGQLPGGWLLDRYGSRAVYGLSLFVWSIVTMLQAFVGWLDTTTAIVTLFCLRFALGLAEAPSFPGNSRIVASWFPTRERGTAAAVFNSAQYFATVAFAPLTGWLTHSFGWEYVFIVMGGLGILMTPIWFRVIAEPRSHPFVSPAEIEHIERGGAVVTSERDASVSAGPTRSAWQDTKQLLSNRMLLGIFIGQYCITTLTYFFLTWFPVYLVQARGLSILQAGFVASLPALCGFFGGILGGIFSDRLLKRGVSLTMARKVPIVGGMLLSTVIIACNYVDAAPLVVAFMALAFFGKGIGSLGWAVVSDTAPKEAQGLCGALFNTFGNTAGITTPIVIGYIVGVTQSFNGALVFIAVNAIAATVCYVFVVGEIKRVQMGPGNAGIINGPVLATR
jgi:MFS transporter, ACS family, glucarate transporter